MIDVCFSHVHLMAHDMEITARWFVGGPAAGGVMAGERQWRDVDVAGIRPLRFAALAGWGGCQ
jgi:hypothetical protein